MSRLTLVFALVASTALAQSVKDFDYLGDPYGNDEFYIGVAIMKSYLSNPDAPYADRHSQSALSGDFNMRSVDFTQGAFRYTYQNKLVGDLIVLTKNVFKNSNNIYRAEGSSLSTGLIGWFNGYWNLNSSSKRYSIAAGFNHNDYFFASTYTVDTLDGGTGGWATLDPNGYFFAAGPSLAADFVLNRWFMLETSMAYSFSYLRPSTNTYAIIDPDYPFPHWGQFNFEVISRLGFHASLNYNWIINRGNLPNNTRRLDLLFGFRVMI